MIADLIAESASQDWLDALPKTDKSLIIELMNAGLNEDQVAEFWLGRSGPSVTAAFGGPGKASNYLTNIKAEFRKLICGDPSYDQLREKIRIEWQKGKTYVVSIVAVAVSTALGVAIGVITPVIALLLSVVCKIGTNAWCSLPPQDLTTA